MQMKRVGMSGSRKTRQEAVRNLLLASTAIFCLLWLPVSAQAAKTEKAKASRAETKPSKSRASSYSSAGGLDGEWEPGDELKFYKQNYLLFYAFSSQPNNFPTSPNPQNRVLTPYALDNRDVKFQISLKFSLADFREYGSLWFGYTQLSFWQFYNVSGSRPFRETNYEPELIYSLRPIESSILNFGLVHQSNGEANPRSRSWNRVYVQPGMDVINDGGRRLTLQVRWWQRIQEDQLTDDNPDITDYLGYREVELRYAERGGWQISSKTRSKSIQLDIAAPLASWLMLDESDERGVNIHLQYFSGYGESLLDYNQNHVTWGVGISAPFAN